MAVTYTSIVKRVLHDLDALSNDAPKKDIEDACAPLRELFLRVGDMGGREASVFKRHIFAMPTYRRLARRHGILIQAQM